MQPTQVGRDEARPPGPTGWRAHAPVLAAYAGLTTIVLWPAARHFTTRPMIGGGDSSIFYWAWWHLPRAIAHGEGVFRTDGLMYPVGVDLRVTVMAPAVAALSWPVRAAWGADAQVNAVQLGSAFLAAAAAYFLILRVCRNRGVAALMGAAYAFTPYRFVQQAEHLNLIHMGLLPTGLVLALRLTEKPSVRRGALLGGWLGFAFLVEPQLGSITAIAVVVLLIGRRAPLRVLMRPASIGLLVALVVATPVLVPLVGGILDDESSTAPSAQDLAAFSSSPLSWVVPPVTHPVLGGIAEVDVLRTSSEGVASPGLLLVGLGLAGASLVAADRRRGWVLLTWVGFVLSLGPFLVVGQERVALPLPYLALRALPFMDTMRTPGRFALIGVLGICVLAAGTLAALLDQHPARRRWLLLACGAVVAFELVPGPLISRDGGAPAPYTTIADDPGAGAVLEVPLQWSTGVEIIGFEQRNVTLFMAWATVHGKPFVGGSVSRLSDERLARLEAVPVYRQVRELQGDPGIGDPVTFGVDDLRQLGIGYVVYHRDIPVPEVLRYVKALDLPVLADDGTVVVWKVPVA